MEPWEGRLVRKVPPMLLRRDVLTLGNSLFSELCALWLSWATFIWYLFPGAHLSSNGGNFAPLPGDIWQHLETTGRFKHYLVGRGQACCQTANHPRTAHNNELWGPKADRTEVEKPYSSFQPFFIIDPLRSLFRHFPLITPFPGNFNMLHYTLDRY